MNGRTVLTDSTHVKASAYAKKNIKILVHKETNNYMERLDFYEEQERQRLEQSGRNAKAVRQRGPNLERIVIHKGRF